jgi:hypothetical protein
MDSVLKAKISEWLSLDRYAATRTEIKQLIDDQNYSALRSALLTRMEFGTAGLWAAMGAGFAVPPHDTNISAAISKCTVLDSAWGENPYEAGAIDVYDDVFAHYFSSLKKEVNHFDLNQASQIRFTYTAMHGVGAEFTIESLKTFGFAEADNIVLVKQQVEPDPDFPTVEFPNPEVELLHAGKHREQPYPSFNCIEGRDEF